MSRHFPYEPFTTSTGGFATRIAASFGRIKTDFAIVVSFWVGLKSVFILEDTLDRPDPLERAQAIKFPQKRFGPH